jgi:hypothetical protein
MATGQRVPGGVVEHGGIVMGGEDLRHAREAPIVLVPPGGRIIGIRDDSGEPQGKRQRGPLHSSM